MLCGDPRLCRGCIVIHHPEGLHCPHPQNGSRPITSRTQRPRSQSSRPGSFPSSGYTRGAAIMAAYIPMVWQPLYRMTAAPDAALSLQCFCDVAGGSPAPNPFTHRPTQLRLKRSLISYSEASFRSILRNDPLFPLHSYTITQPRLSVPASPAACIPVPVCGFILHTPAILSELRPYNGDKFIQHFIHLQTTKKYPFF